MRGRFAAWLSARGLIRVLNTVGRPDWPVSTYVETALPLRWIALLAADPDTRHVARVERVGPLRRRWTLTR